MIKAFIIGGSAGSIEILKELLPQLPNDRSFPVIVVLHILARSQSLLPTIFNKLCPWPVKDAESTEPIENGIVYFAPSDYHLSIEGDGTFSLSNEAPVNYSRPSIDLFFESAAAYYKEGLCGLLLSGSNSDGTLGFQEILRRGGQCFAQAPETAEFPEMPQAALNVSRLVRPMKSSELIEFLNRRSPVSLL